MERLANRIRLLIIAAAVLIVLTVMTIPAHAGGDVELGNIIRGANKDGTFYSGDRAYVKMSDIDSAYGGPGAFSSLYAENKVDAHFKAGETDLAAFYDKEKEEFYYNVHPNCFGKELYFFTETKTDNSHYNNNTDSILVSTYVNFSISKAGVVTVTGESIGHTFKNVKVDASKSVLPDSQIGKNKISFTFSVTNQSSYPVGRHSLTGYLDDSTECAPLNKIPVSIYVKPAFGAGMFESEKDSFVFSPGSFASANYGDIYIDYKKGKSGTWSTQWGPFGPSSSGRIAKLSPSTTYYVRAYYVKKVGTEYFIGPVSSEVAIKTGPKAKPKPKSVTISKAKVKKVWVKPILNVFGLVVKKGYYAYETTYKVTIKFKKKPGVAGIEVYAGGVTLPKYLKGNKKTYSTKFPVGGKAKGKKTNFQIHTKGNKTYGAWSPFFKTKKIKIK